MGSTASSISTTVSATTGVGPASPAAIPTATAVGACAIPAAATTPAIVVAFAKWHERLGWTTAVVKSDSQRYMYSKAMSHPLHEYEDDSSYLSLSTSVCAKRWASSGYLAVMRFPSSTTNGFRMLPPCMKSLLCLSTLTVSSSTYSG